LLPQEVNFRANLWGLRQLGVRRIFATVACGGLLAEQAPGDLAVLSDFLDFTQGRPRTFHGAPGLPESVDFYHSDFQPPYCPQLNALLQDAAAAQLGRTLPEATYACMEGPRYESPAEVR